MQLVNRGVLVLVFSLFFLIQSFGQTTFESKMGEKQNKMLMITYGFYENPGLLSVVEEVGHKLEEHLELGYPLKFFLLDMEEPNAFATTGGYVYVTRGLLALLNTKDELAGVLGHELSHVTQHHNKKKMYSSIIPAVLEIPANIIGLLTYSEVADVLNFPIEATTNIAIAGYSREMESNADKLGIELAAKAGYNPYALADILTRLTDFVEYLTQEEMKNSIYIDHPMTPKRVERIYELNEKNGREIQETFPGTELTEINGLIYGQNPEGGIVHDSAFIHAGIGFYCEFPKGWQINNSPLSITSMAKDKNSLMMVTIDNSPYEPSKLIKNELGKMKGSVLLKHEETEINGLACVRLTLESESAKHADKMTEIVWLRLPEGKGLLKIHTVTKAKVFPNIEITQSLASFRMASPSDYEGFSYSVIELKETNDDEDGDVKLKSIMNGIKDSTDVPSNRYIKVIGNRSFLGY